MRSQTETTNPHADATECVLGIREIANLMIGHTNQGDLGSAISHLAERALKRLEEIAPSA